MKTNVIVLVGVSGAGKSTFATNFVKENPSYLIVNRDSINSYQIKGDEFVDKPAVQYIDKQFYKYQEIRAWLNEHYEKQLI